MKKFCPSLVALGVIAVFACLGTGRAEAQFDLQKGSKTAQKLVEGGTSFAKSRLAMRQYQHLLQASTTFENMGKLAKDVQKYKSLAKLGACLGVAFAVADAFGVFGPSADEQTMAAIKEVSGKIDRLEETMTNRFDQLEDKILTAIQRESAKTQVRAHINRLSANQREVDLYLTLLHDKNSDYARIDQQERQLTTGISPAEIFEAVHGVYEQVLGENLATDLMESEYKATFGDMSRALQTNMMLLKLVQQGQTNFEMVSVMKLRRGDENDLRKELPKPVDRVKYNKTLTAAEIDAIAANGLAKFGPLYTAIAERLEKYAQKGAAERTANVMKFMEDRFGGKANSTRKTPANWASWDAAEGQHSPGGFKKTPGQQPQTTSDYQQKYGSLAQELKDKYFCDWLVMVYHPIQRVSQNKFTGLANYNTWNWSGTNCIWFLENDPDYNCGSQLVFVLLQPYDAPPPATNVTLATKPWAELQKASPLTKRPNQLTGFSPADLDFQNFNDGSTTFKGVDIVHGLFGKETVSTPAGNHIETGLALQFRVAAPGSGGVSARGMNVGSATFDSYAVPKFTQPRPGVIVAPDSKHNAVDPHDNGLYGALYLKTTTPTRLAVQQGKGRIMILHSNVSRSAAAPPSVAPPPIPDIALKPIFGEVTLKAGFNPHVKNLTAGGPMKTDLGGVKASVTKEPSYKLHYTAGKNPLTFLAESKKGDTTLLINLPDGRWIANDDGGGNLNSMLRFDNPQSGRYDIYVGTYGSSSAPAPATLTIREGK